MNNCTQILFLAIQMAKALNAGHTFFGAMKLISNSMFAWD